jgi:hypothetical protein
MVGRTMMRPPSGRLGPITPEERKAVMAGSPVAGLYDKAEDRESAYEVLQARVKRQQDEAPADEPARDREPAREKEPAPRRSTRASPLEAFITSASRSAANTIVRELTRTIFGTLRRGRR